MVRMKGIGCSGWLQLLIHEADAADLTSSAFSLMRCRVCILVRSIVDGDGGVEESTK